MRWIQSVRTAGVYPLTLLAVGVAGLIPMVPYALFVAWCYLALLGATGTLVATLVVGAVVFLTLPPALFVVLSLELLVLERLPWTVPRAR